MRITEHASARVRGRVRGHGLRLLLSALVWAGCAGSPAPTAQSGSGPRRVPLCGVDRVREYYCDDLLPLANAMPAPPPYETCPASIDGPPGEYDPAPNVGIFDASYTEYTRKRAPPGHSCCYSWCSKVKIADPASPAAQASCSTAAAFREEYCMSELENGTSVAAPPPFDRCPAAIVPPAKAVFAVPPAALFDPNLTAGHRGKGQAECCYAWCSQAPPGSGLHKK